MEVEALAARQIAECVVGSDEVPELIVGYAPDAHAEVVIAHADDAVTYRTQDARPGAGNDSCHPQSQRRGGEQPGQCRNEWSAKIVFGSGRNGGYPPGHETQARGRAACHGGARPPVAILISAPRPPAPR